MFAIGKRLQISNAFGDTRTSSLFLFFFFFFSGANTFVMDIVCDITVVQACFLADLFLRIFQSLHGVIADAGDVGMRSCQSKNCLP